jgi:mycofactocin precursor
VTTTASSTTAPSPTGQPTEAIPVDVAGTQEPVGGERLVEADLLVEDVSIDGMCGVY